MKQYLFLATTIATASLFTGCSNNEYVGDQPEAFNGTDGAIAFSMGKANTTRAIGSEAAGKLNEVFYVYGTKTVAGRTSTVFKDYKVVYDNDNANKSTSNTKGWEYVGKQEERAPAQTIKYWDYSADKYDFEAYSISRAYINNETGQRTVTRNTEKVGEYIVSDINQNDCATLYFAKKNTVNKNSSTEGSRYQDAVKLEFQSVLSKIRVGFYETIPGYSVKITKFYGSNGDANGWGSGDGQKFVAWCPNKKIDNNNNSFVVQYETATPAITQVKKGDTYQPISSAPSTGGYTLDKDLTLGDNLLKDNTTIGESSSKVTWDNVDNNTSKYTYVIPQNQIELWQDDSRQVQPMKIKVDYTLTSTDGSGEVINVTGATAIVPAEYLRWKPNTAYSYIFKISDNTNGSTGGEGGIEGLYPITFDAVVEDYANEGSTTTVSTPSVTAKQDGTTAGYVIPEGIVFQLNTPIELKVMTEEGAVANPEITGGYIEGDTYNYDLTPEQNLTNGNGSFENTVSLDNNKLAKQPRAGYWVLKVKYSNRETNVFTYVIIRVGNPEVGPANPAN